MAAKTTPKRKATPKASKSSHKALILGLDYDHECEADGDGYRRGVHTGLLLTHFLNGLFWSAYDEGWTDEELTSIMKEEFPDRPLQSVGAYRSYFNGGKHGHGVMGDEGIEKPETPLRRVGR